MAPPASLTPSAKKLYGVFVASSTNHLGTCFVGLYDLGRATGCSKRTLIRAIALLEAEGYPLVRGQHGCESSYEPLLRPDDRAEASATPRVSYTRPRQSNTGSVKKMTPRSYNWRRGICGPVNRKAPVPPLHEPNAQKFEYLLSLAATRDLEQLAPPPEPPEGTPKANRAQTGPQLDAEDARRRREVAEAERMERHYAMFPEARPLPAPPTVAACEKLRRSMADRNAAYAVKQAAIQTDLRRRVDDLHARLRQRPQQVRRTPGQHRPRPSQRSLRLP